MIKIRSKLMTTSLAAVLTLSLNGVPVMAQGTAAKQDQDIVILYTNDIHCGINEKESIGMDGVAAYKTDMIQQYGEDQVTLVDCGDAIQGAPIGTLSNGEYMVAMMNAVGYDYAVFGNHEFDYGIPQLKYLVEEADVTYLGCNFKYIEPEKEEKEKAGEKIEEDEKSVDTQPVQIKEHKEEAETDKKDETGKEIKEDAEEIKEEVDEEPLVIKPYEIKDYNGVKVAYIGICTPESLFKSVPTYFMDEEGHYLYSFYQDQDGKALYTEVQNTVDAARAEGADYVVALSHLGVEEGSTPYRSTDVIANTAGIDVVLDGHSHTVMAEAEVKNKEGEEVILSQTGSKLENLGKLVIKTDGTLSTELINNTSYTKKDEKVQTAIKELEEELSETLNKVVAQSEVALEVNAEDGTRAIRNRETALGDFCADAYRSVSGADIALVNGGGIRASLPKGDITYSDMISVHPYGNELCVVKATGQEILDALELGSKNTTEAATVKLKDGTLGAAGESGGFLQVSGLTYTIDPSIASTVVTDENGLFVEVKGERRVKDVQVFNRQMGQYEALKPEQIYTVASHNYLIKDEGDGYSMFKDNELVQDSVMLDNQVLIKYIQDTLEGSIGKDYSSTQGRIQVRVEAAKADIKKAA